PRPAPGGAGEVWGGPIPALAPSPERATIPAPRSTRTDTHRADIAQPELTKTYAHDQPTHPQPPPRSEDQVQDEGHGRVPAEARGVPDRPDHDAEEAELGSAEDRPRAAVEREGSDGVH